MSAKVIILEGTRGAGKSSVAQLLRKRLWGSTLINLTGFSENGEEGLQKVSHYYDAWAKLLDHLDGDYTIIFDRTFFSEMVYSVIYKDYTFYPKYMDLCHELVNTMARTGDLYLFYLKVNDLDVLKERLADRNKALLFDQVAENIQNSVKQQEQYDQVVRDFDKGFIHMDHVHVKEIDTSYKSIEEVYDVILDTIQ